MLHSAGFRRLTAEPTLAAWRALLAKDTYGTMSLELVGCNPLLQAHASRDGTTLAFPMLCTNGAANVFNTMHGGELLSLVDMVTSLHFVHSVAGDKPHATSHLGTQFLRAVPVGAELVALTTMRREGRTGFVDTRLVPMEALDECADGRAGKAFAVGNATKALLKR